jgi:hypothetical protein
MNLSHKKIASILFWSHLIPAACLLILAQLVFMGEVDEPPSWRNYLAIPIGLPEIVGCLIYFLQFNFKKHAEKKALWLYSIMANIIYGFVFILIAIEGFSVWLIFICLFFWGSAYLCLISFRNIDKQATML